MIFTRNAPVRFSRWLAVALACAALGASLRAAPPIELVFQPVVDVRDPFQRDIWAEVTLPSGKVLQLPAFYQGDDRFAVRVRADEEGIYQLGAVTERDPKGIDAPRTVKLSTPAEDARTILGTTKLRSVTRSKTDPARLVYSDGTPYMPIGTNLAWPPGDAKLNYYGKVFGDFRREHLNWMRIWMAHWSGLNLDWPAAKYDTLNLRASSEWDKIIAAADERGVYVQLVLQHHGQYSTTVNPNWPANPWNAANPGGFLKSPSDFFTSPKARELTRWKYRYIVARWGYSPAIVAWELFNEVHWVDAMRQDKREADVAAWHTEMAKYIRSVDVYGHLITTSTEDLNSPVYTAMDYYQPHLYTADVIAGARAFMRAPGELDRPVFYGEMGDDHLPLSEKQKKSGISIVPPVWASLMGQGRLPAQPWLGADLIEQKRLGELGAVARFIEATQLDRRTNLTPFSAVVDSESRVPFVIMGVQRWQRRDPPEIDLPLDGQELVEFANIPQIYAGSLPARSAGIPDRATYRLNAPRELQGRAVVTGMNKDHGSSIRIYVDRKSVAEEIWGWGGKPAVAASATQPIEVRFTIPAGAHTLVVENPAGPDWFELAKLEFDLEVSALAAIGQRNGDFIAVWLWHRTNVYSLEPSAAISGKVNIENVPAGRWQVVWWNSVQGAPSAPVTIEHAGGTLQVATPAISRHAAVVLTRQ